MRMKFQTRILEASERRLKAQSTVDGSTNSYKGFDFVLWSAQQETKALATPLLRGKLVSDAQLDKKDVCSCAARYSYSNTIMFSVPATVRL